MSKTIRKQLRSFLALSMAILLVLSLVPAVSASTAEPFSATVDFGTYTTETLRAALADGENTITLADNKGTLSFTNDPRMGAETFSIADGKLKVVNYMSNDADNASKLVYTWPEALSGKVEIGFTVKAGMANQLDGSDLTGVSYNTNGSFVTIQNQNGTDNVTHYENGYNGRLHFSNKLKAECCSDTTREGELVSKDNILATTYMKTKVVLDFETNQAKAYRWDETAADWVDVVHKYKSHQMIAGFDSPANGTKSVTFNFNPVFNNGNMLTYGHYWVDDITVKELVPPTQWTMDFSTITTEALNTALAGNGVIKLEDGATITLAKNTNGNCTATSQEYSIEDGALKFVIDKPRYSNANVTIAWPEMAHSDVVHLEFDLKAGATKNDALINFSTNHDKFINIKNETKSASVIDLDLESGARLALYRTLTDVVTHNVVKNCCPTVTEGTAYTSGTAGAYTGSSFTKYRLELDFATKNVCMWQHDGTQWVRLGHYTGSQNFHQLEAPFVTSTANGTSAITFNFGTDAYYTDLAHFWIDNISIKNVADADISVPQSAVKVYAADDDTKTNLSALTEGQEITVSALYNNAEGRSPENVQMYVAVYNESDGLERVYATAATTKVTTGYTAFGGALKNSSAKTEDNEVTLTFTTPANASYLKVLPWNNLLEMNPYDAVITLLD